MLVKIDTSRNLEAFQDEVTALANVLECHHIAGPSDYLLKVLVKDMQDLETFLSCTMKDLPGVTETQTLFCLSTLKEEFSV